MDISQYFDSVEAAQESLTNLLTIVGGCSERCEQEIPEYENAENRLSDLKEKIQAVIDALEELLEAGTNEQVEAVARAVQVVVELLQILAESGQSAQDEASGCDETAHTCMNACQGSESELDEDFSSWEDEFNQCSEAIDSRQESLGAVCEACLQGLSEAEAMIEQLQSRLDTCIADCEAAKSELTGNLSGNCTSRCETMFSELTNDLQERCLGQYDQLCSGLQEGLDDLDESFGRSCNDLGEDLMNECNGMIESTCGTLKDDLSEELEQCFKDAVEETLEEALQACIEQFGIMTTGAEVTAVMSPILPEIMTAAKAIKATNAVLDAIGG